MLLYLVKVFLNFIFFLGKCFEIETNSPKPPKLIQDFTRGIKTQQGTVKVGTMGAGMAVADDDSSVVGFPTFSPINTNGRKFIKITGGNILKLEINGVTTPQSKSFQDFRKQLGKGKDRIPYLGSAVASGATNIYLQFSKI